MIGPSDEGDPASMEVRRLRESSLAAVLAALQVDAARSGGLAPWMPAADLAAWVGASGIDDAEFQAAVQGLFETGAIRLMGASGANGGNFYKAMCVPAA